MKTNRNDKIETIKIKIEQNEQIRDKAIEMSRILKDKTAKEQCETQIKESEKYVAYLYEELQQLNNVGLTETGSSISDSSSSSNSTSRRQSIFKRMSVPVQSIGKIAATTTAEEGVVSSMGTPLTSRSDELKKRKDNIRRTSLDLLKANNPINRDRITLMLHELENKLHILQRAQSDARNVFTAMNASTDRRWHTDAHKKRIDYQEKIILLKKAIQKYRNLNIDDFGSAERLRPSVGRTTTLVPASGKLRLKVLEARELTHAPSHTFPITQTYVTVRVTGQRECKTKMSRNDTWMDTFETDVNKAAEIEIVIYDAAGDRNLPIGMLWLRMIDIAEDLRQLKKKHSKSNNNNVRDTIDSETESSYSDTSSSIVSTTDGFTEWFNVEPFGRLHLHLNFVRKEAKRTGPINKLRRAGAFKEREGQVRYVNGHTFISGRFYQVMRCAVSCHMACHKDCCIRMAARCISGELSAQNDEEDEFKYNIPHRFENITLIGTNWCSHCGLILPLGYRGAKKCTECGIICHSSCKVFVPDFCGITLDRAYEMWKQYKNTNDRRRSSQLDKIFVRLQMGGCQQRTFAEGVQALMHGEMSRDKAPVGSDIQIPMTTPTIERQRPTSQISSYRMND
ncbi:hypothetical protein INT45_000029 [Circinella minor]|uniref:Protein kinase C n=1 Tax=Circinella minor TaxID=1195481 RepID=A0A8H7VCI4_9FUNG|nr:hypothetical protein INT45_000029 [Circinella minor]